MRPPFDSLTLRGRARRLRPLARAALAAYDLDVQRVRLLSNTWNCVFRVDSRQGRFVLRICLPGHGHRPELVQSEAAFLAALAADSDIEVLRPIPTRDGRLVVRAGAPDVPEERMCVLFSWVPGRMLAKDITPATFEQHGALHARLHHFAAAWTPPPQFAIRDFTHTLHFPDDVVVWDAELFGHSALFREAHAASDALIARVRARDAVIVTHGDLHQGNVLVHRGVLRPIDFEEVMWATRVQDVATSLYYVSARPNRVALQDAFRRGYERIAPWVEGEPGEIERLLFARALVLLNFLAVEPAFRSRDWSVTVERAARLARIVVA